MPCLLLTRTIKWIDSYRIESRNGRKSLQESANSQRPAWTVIGGGNGGQALAGQLAMMGFSVCLYDIVPETVEAIRRRGCIRVDGVVQGDGAVAGVTGDLAEALDGADIVMVVAPAVAHADIARQCAPVLQDGQIVFIHPGATGGALEFRQVLDRQNCRAAVALAEANSLLYACRLSEPGCVSIFGIKKELTVTALPATATGKVLGRLQTAFPQMKPGRNVLETSLGNPNAMMHPAPTLLNTSMIESGRDWLYYWDGITPTIGDFVESMDGERLALAAAFGMQLPSIRSWYRMAYGVQGDSLSEVVRKNSAYSGVRGQKSLLTRYILEDVPTGLVPMVSLGRQLNIDMPRMDTVIRMCEFLIGRDLSAAGRTAERLGLAGMDAEQILRYVETGRR
jgi:opine dehydrogenase